MDATLKEIADVATGDTSKYWIDFRERSAAAMNRLRGERMSLSRRATLSSALYFVLALLGLVGAFATMTIWAPSLLVGLGIAAGGFAAGKAIGLITAKYDLDNSGGLAYASLTTDVVSVSVGELGKARESALTKRIEEAFEARRYVGYPSVELHLKDALKIGILGVVGTALAICSQIMSIIDTYGSMQDMDRLLVDADGLDKVIADLDMQTTSFYQDNASFRGRRILYLAHHYAALEQQVGRRCAEPMRDRVRLPGNTYLDFSNGRPAQRRLPITVIRPNQAPAAIMPPL